MFNLSSKSEKKKSTHHLTATVEEKMPSLFLSFKNFTGNIITSMKLWNIIGIFYRNQIEGERDINVRNVHKFHHYMAFVWLS